MDSYSKYFLHAHFHDKFDSYKLPRTARDKWGAGGWGHVEQAIKQVDA